MDSDNAVQDLCTTYKPKHQLDIIDTLAGGVDECAEQDVEQGLRSLGHFPADDLENIL